MGAHCIGVVVGHAGITVSHSHRYQMHCDIEAGQLSTSTSAVVGGGCCHFCQGQRYHGGVDGCKHSTVLVKSSQDCRDEKISSDIVRVSINQKSKLSIGLIITILHCGCKQATRSKALNGKQKLATLIKRSCRLGVFNPFTPPPQVSRPSISNAMRKTKVEMTGWWNVDRL